MTSGEIVGMSVVESLVQALAGIVLGAVAWAATLPAADAAVLPEPARSACRRTPDALVAVARR
jgi:hypothetical protein